MLLDETSRLLFLIFGNTHSLPHFRRRTYGCLCNCNMNFTTRCWFIFLSCYFEACLMEVQSVSALLLPGNMLLCEYRMLIGSVCFLCEVSCTCPGKSLRNRIRKSLRPVRVLSIRPHYHKLTVNQVGVTTCKTVCIGKMARRCRFT